MERKEQMILLDIQGMSSGSPAAGGGRGSDVSLMLCDSACSVTLCA